MPTGKIKLSDLLFRGSSATKIPISNNELGVNSSAPRGQYFSAARASAGGSLSSPAKINHAATVMDAIFNGRVAVVEGRDSGQIYMEYSGSSGVSRVWYEGRTLNWDGAEPASASRLCAPFVLYALQKYSPMTETKTMFENCYRDFVANGFVQAANLYKFCDAFYYEYKSKIGYGETVSDGNMNENLVRQAIRTGTLTEFSLFRDLGFAPAEVQIADVAPTAGVTGAKNTGDIFAMCKAGKKAIDYPWSIEQRARIPDLDDLEEFIPNKQFFAMLDLAETQLGIVNERLNEGVYGVKAIKNNYVNMLMVGKPGTGKTTIANALAATLQMPIYVVAADKNSEGDLFTGMTKVIDGQFQFVKTPFVNGYENGGIIVLEEINLADPGVVMGALGQAVEKPFILAVNGYEEVRRHPMCIVIATMNSGTQGSREASEAFTSRFPDTYPLEDPTMEDSLAIFESHGHSKSNAKWVYNVYQKVLAALKNRHSEDVMLAVTQRHCLAALRQLQLGKSRREAAQNTFIGAIATKDRVLADEIYESVVKVLPDA